MSEKTLYFKPGQTFFSATPDNSTDGNNILGQEIEIRDLVRVNGRIRRMRAVRNSSGAAVLPSRIVQLDTNGLTITGYGTLLAPATAKLAVVDELLPSAGAASNDILWVTVRGPVLALTDLANYAADIAPGTFIVCQTAVTTGATTAGRLRARNITAPTADATAYQRNLTDTDATFGRAASTALTNSTNYSLLVDVSPW